MKPMHFKRKIVYKKEHEIRTWLQMHDVLDCTLIESLEHGFVVDVGGTVELSNLRDLEDNSLNYIPIKFNKIHGSFLCSHCSLVTLIGGPNIVEGYFHCQYNAISNLIGGPLFVSSHYTCSGNRLTSLEGVPRHIVKDFDAASNQIESLQHCPKIIGGQFDMQDNLLTNIDYIPENVGGNCYFYGNEELSIDEKNIDSYEDLYMAHAAYRARIERENIQEELGSKDKDRCEESNGVGNLVKNHKNKI